MTPKSKQRAGVAQFANECYRPDTAESKALEKTLNVEVAASNLNLQPQPKMGSKTWVRLIAKVYEVDPSKCEGCCEAMKLIAFIKDAISITKILAHVGEEVKASKMQSARPPPEVYQVENEIEGYLEPEYHYDQSLNW